MDIHCPKGSVILKHHACHHRLIFGRSTTESPNPPNSTRLEKQGAGVRGEPGGGRGEKGGGDSFTWNWKQFLDFWVFGFLVSTFQSFNNILHALLDEYLSVLQQFHSMFSRRFRSHMQVARNILRRIFMISHYLISERLRFSKIINCSKHVRFSWMF